MTKEDIQRLGGILAVQAEVEAMKAENSQRKVLNESMAYVDADFNRCKELLILIASAADYQVVDYVISL